MKAMLDRSRAVARRIVCAGALLVCGWAGPAPGEDDNVTPGSEVSFDSQPAEGKQGNDLLTHAVVVLNF